MKVSICSFKTLISIIVLIISLLLYQNFKEPFPRSLYTKSITNVLEPLHQRVVDHGSTIQHHPNVVCNSAKMDSNNLAKTIRTSIEIIELSSLQLYRSGVIVQNTSCDNAPTILEETRLAMNTIEELITMFTAKINDHDSYLDSTQADIQRVRSYTTRNSRQRLNELKFATVQEQEEADVELEACCDRLEEIVQLSTQFVNFLRSEIANYQNIHELMDDMVLYVERPCKENLDGARDRLIITYKTYIFFREPHLELD